MPGRALALALASTLLVSACGGGSKKTSSGYVGQLGDQCLPPSYPCASSLACIDSRCAATPTKAGDACDLATTCPAPLGCVFGRCTALATSGGACGPTAPCAAPQACVNGACVARAAAGACPAGPAPITIGTFSIDPALASKYAAVANNATADAAHCVLPVQVPVGNGTVTQLAHAAAGVGSVVSFTVPAGTTALSVVSQEVNASVPDTFTTSGKVVSNYVAPTDVTYGGAAGKVLYDDATVPFPITDPNTYANLLAYSAGSAVGAGAFTIPNTSRGLDDLLAAGVFPSGPWSVVVGDWNFEFTGARVGTYDVTVLARTAPPAASGTVDVAVYLVSHGALTAATAATDAGFLRWAQSYQTLLAGLGVCLGTIRVYDVPQWAKDRWYTIDVDKDKPCDPEAQLFTLAQRVDAVHLFFVDDLTSAQLGQGQVLAGIDGAVPGPSLVPGNVSSGAAVAIGSDLGAGSCNGPIDTRACGSDSLALVSVHETGHWLGLYHTTESDGSAFDPLRDTPACPCSTCASSPLKCGTAGGPQFLTSQCMSPSRGCGGGSNLMFWLQTDGLSTGAVTPEQSAVVRLNPAVH